MFRRYDLVPRPAQHQYGRLGRDEGDFGDGVPFLVAEEGEAGEHGHCGGDEAWDGEEGVFED